MPLTASQCTAAWVLNLSLGQDNSAELPAPDWTDVLSAATRERCAALAWHRNGARIRGEAPAVVVAEWRAMAVLSALRAELQAAALHEVVDCFAERGVRASAMKGLPLAQRLYGDPSVRMTADVDLYVAAADRRAAAESLGILGWTLCDGHAPFEEIFQRADRRGLLHLEIHTRLSSPIVDYLRPAIGEPVPVLVGGRAVPTFAGVSEPAYLALHCAGHWMPALLWFIDFATLWSSMSPSEQAASREVAAGAGLQRYLAWALERASALPAAAGGVASALGVLGIRADGRHDEHPFRRHLRCAVSVRGVVALLFAAVVPPDLRNSPRRLLKRWLARLSAPRLGIGGRFRRYISA